MAEKSLKVQLRQRRATSTYWSAHEQDVTPGAGEIIVYLPDETQTDISFKIGDGKNTLQALPMFVKVSGGPKGDKGDTGADGIGIAEVKIENSNLMLKYTNSDNYINLGKVVGDKGADGAAGTPGTNGKDGTNGYTFTPAVSSEGVISWSNNGGLSNPADVNIKGPKGEQGTKGDNGETGATGDGIKSITKTSTAGLVDTYTITFTSGKTPTTFTVTNGQNGSDATVQWDTF